MLTNRFVVGVNLPWVHYGGDFGANAWRPAGGLSQPDRYAEADATLARIADRGISLIRWFVLCDARAGVRIAADGRPTGLDNATARDLDAAIALLEKRSLRAVFVLLDFLLAQRGRVVNGVQTRGRVTWLRGEHARGALVERVLRPLAAHVNGAAAVHAWDLLNEPEWVTLGWGGLDPWQCVSARTMRRFLRDCVAGVRSVSPAPVTVGLSSARGLPLVRDLGLDFYQVHWYDHVDPPASLAAPVADLGLDAPLVLGEFPTAGSSQRPSGILATARGAGYAGAWAWSFLAADEFSSGAACEGDVAEFIRGTGSATT
jgi:hypothetical protein